MVDIPLVVEPRWNLVEIDWNPMERERGVSARRRRQRSAVRYTDAVEAAIASHV
jgi:hypothetical protein